MCNGQQQHLESLQLKSFLDEHDVLEVFYADDCPISAPLSNKDAFSFFFFFDVLLTIFVMNLLFVV